MQPSRLRERVAFQLIGTPVEQPLRWIRSLREVMDRRRHPEWNSVRDEGKAIEHLLKRAIRTDTNCIDIGCHLGAVLDRMQTYAPSGKHIAFEPTPYKYSWLKSKYPDVEVHQEALSDQPGEAEFYYQTDHSGFSGLRSHTTAGWKTETFKVQRARLDDVLGDRKVGFIKIDVEGAEPLVFLGAEKTLRQSRPHILFECTLSGLQLFDWTPTAMYDLLCRKHGYSIYIVSDWLGNRPPLTVESFIAAMSHPAQAFNFFATQSV